MVVRKRGGWLEVTMALPYPLVQQVLKQSSAREGVEYRLFLSKDVKIEGLQAHMCWVKLLEAKPIAQLHQAPAGQPWFAGLLSGDKPDRVGVRVWGGPVQQQVRAEIASLLGIKFQAPTTTVRVRGYGLSFGLVSGDQQVAQREADKVFGANVVSVKHTRHLQKSGLERPVYDVELTGVPPTWEGEVVPAGDSRMPDKKWQRIVRKTPPPVYQRVGQKASLPAVEANDKSDEMDTDANPEDPNLL